MINCTFVPDCTRKGNNYDLFGDYLFEIVNKNVGIIASKFYSVLSTEDIEDLVHDTWMKINDKRDQYNPKGNFEGWVYRICCNNIYSLTRKRSMLKCTQRSLPEKYEMEESPAFLDERSTDFPIIQREGVRHIESGIQSLRPAQQNVVRLLIEEVPYKKMATVIGCRENTVKTQVCRVRQELKKAI